mmetsp:Transcript_32902/g.52701  ORF Transcript_32902/g.52701 Transcript_32902/m.52701 type:complete len:216 (+) Transcript_32902:174-821(+)
MKRHLRGKVRTRTLSIILHPAPYVWKDCLLEQALDICLDTKRASCGQIPLHHLAVGVDEKLSEVPLDIVADCGSDAPLLLGLFHPLVEGCGVGAVDVNLVHHSECDVVFCDETLDLRVGTTLLRSELVTWECQNFKVRRLVRVVQRHELLVVSVSQASRRCDVDDEQSLALEIAHVHANAVDVLDREVVRGSGDGGGVAPEEPAEGLEHRQPRFF